ncbi:KAP family P-loop NTPase fold protein [Acinetobacter nosocomialis]|uniref:KAP family P-loop NTPase fold protein n=1 Tax=Acinetobacter nosocomialis TaxID=106654 RepID=UPI001B81F382|nr:P-loop NTPase fold protein [Acinetobacter nosocomialis]MBR7717927.1 NTPase [Acinetobacter nosocomialis]
MVTETSPELRWIKDNDDIQEPFENDLWNRTNLADQLENYISRIKVGATVAIDAEWGAGKSWFVKHWKARLVQKEFKVIYLNAFTQDYIEDPFLTIAMEIANVLEAEQKDIEKIKSTIGDAYRAILPNLPLLIFQLAMTFMGAGKMAKQVAETFENLKDDTGAFGEAAAELLNEKLKEHLSAQVDNYENEKKSLEYFKTQLTEITKDLEKPLVFIVDELDRCKPEFAIRLIERIKHFFDIPKVVFILAVNKRQLEESINSFYGFTSSSKYLEKFIDINVLLKNGIQNELDYTKIIDSYIEKLGINLNSEIDIKQCNTICLIYKPNSRQLIRIFNKLALLENNFDNRKISFLFLILMYIELDLLKEFNELNFINFFYESHYKELGKKYQKNVEARGVRTYSFQSFLLNLYGNSGLYPFLGYLIYKKFSGDSNANPHGADPYLLRNNNGTDFVLQWHNYVHLVE